MPQCIFIICWDQLEGAIIKSQYPAGFEIKTNNVQTIDIAHSFTKDSPWVVVEEEGFKAVSFYNESLLKSVALVLHPNEVPGNFIKFLEQIAEFILPVENDAAVATRLQEAFGLIQAEIPIAEVVLLNFANEIQQLKEKLVDIKDQIRGVAEISTDFSIKILLDLIVNEECSVEKIFSDLEALGCKKTDIIAGLDALLQKQMILVKNNKYSINPRIEKSG